MGLQHVVGEQVFQFLKDNDFASWESDSENDSEVLCETAGRVCYLSFAKPRPGGNAAYLQHIKESGHGSVLEHAVWNLLVTGVSRSLTHQLVRHRVGAGYSQLSERYVDESRAEYVVPPDLQEEVAAARRFMHANNIDNASLALEWAVNGEHSMTDVEIAGLEWIESAEIDTRKYKFLSDYLAEKVRRQEFEADPGAKNLTYDDWCQLYSQVHEKSREHRKYARQAARSVLPSATETKIFLTINARAARNVIEQRGSKHAEPEIRMLAYKIWQVLNQEAPNLFGDYLWTAQIGGRVVFINTDAPDSITETPVIPLDVTTPYRKV